MKKTRLVLKKKFVIMLIVFFLSLGIYSFAKIILWYKDSLTTEEKINELNDKTDIVEVKDSEKTQIVNAELSENIDKSNPYWDYIKMNLMDVSFDKLKQENPDVVGWIKVNGTNINYPFLQTKNNTDYLKRDFNKKYNSAGWVFLDYRNDIKNFSKNTIIYAHGRVDGTMFGSLKNIMKSSWYNNLDNHIVKLSTEYENTLWQVFSIYKIPTTSDYLQIDFNSSSNYLEFLNMLKERSAFSFDAVLNEEDKILTLSTCSNDDGRVVLHAKLIKKEIKNNGSN